MLPARNRLRNSLDIKNVFADGKSTRCGFLFLKYVENSEEFTRFAFSIGLSYSRSAVKRNTFKRRLRAIVSKHLDNIKNGFDCVFFVKGANEDKRDKKILEELVKNCLKRSGLRTK